MVASLMSSIRRHSQRTAFVIGLLIAGGGAVSWAAGWLNPISGSLFVGVGSSVIAAAIVAFLSPFGEEAYRKLVALGIDMVWPSRQDIDPERWVEWLSEAKNKCTLLGIAHGNWCGDTNFKPTLIDRLEHGVRTKVFFLNPNSLLAGVRAGEEKHRDTKTAIRKSIAILWNLRKALEAASRDRLRLYVYDATPSCGMTWIDDIMIVTHYLAGSPNKTSPALYVKPPAVGMERGSLYSIYADNADLIETGSSVEITETNVNEYLLNEEQIHDA